MPEQKVGKGAPHEGQSLNINIHTAPSSIVQHQAIRRNPSLFDHSDYFQYRNKFVFGVALIGLAVVTASVFLLYGRLRNITNFIDYYPGKSSLIWIAAFAAFCLLAGILFIRYSWTIVYEHRQSKKAFFKKQKAKAAAMSNASSTAGSQQADETSAVIYDSPAIGVNPVETSDMVS